MSNDWTILLRHHDIFSSPLRWNLCVFFSWPVFISTTYFFPYLCTHVMVEYIRLFSCFLFHIWGNCGCGVKGEMWGALWGEMWGDCKVHCGVHCAVKCGVHCGVHCGRKVRYCKIPYNIVGARPAICKSGIKDHAYCGLIQPGIWRTILEGLRILQQTKARCSEWKAGDSQKTPHGVVSGNADTPRTGNCASHNQPPSFFFGKSTSNSPGKRLDEESMGHGVNAIKENVPGALWNMMNIMILLTCDKPVNSHFVLWKWTHADMQEKYNYNHNKIALI